MGSSAVEPGRVWTQTVYCPCVLKPLLTASLTLAGSWPGSLEVGCCLYLLVLAHTEELCESWPVWPLTTKGGGELLPAQVTFRDSASC